MNTSKDAPMTPQQFWNKRYETEDYLFGRAPNQFLASQAHRLPASGRALAIADGEGRNGVFLATRGLEVLSVDFSEHAQAKAQKLADAHNVSIHTEQVNLFDWPCPIGEFDVVAAIFFQFATPQQRPQLFQMVKDALKPGGLLLLQGYRPEQLEYGTGGPPQRENMYTEELLREHFSDMNILELTSHDSEVDEGPGHSGMSALIDLVALR